MLKILKMFALKILCFPTQQKKTRKMAKIPILQGAQQG
jgi:hypothetical protein